MSDAREVERHFVALLELDGAARARSLAALEADLRAEVLELLSFHDRPSSLLDLPLLARAQPTPARVGPFTLLEPLGEGGMGVVWLARQDRPEREVALKMLRGGLWSAGTLARFRREAELLARLHHPGIAQVYAVGDAGDAHDPRPWFAMERIEGPTLLEWSARGRRDLRARLELLAEIGDALEHAHRRGIVHRDLKPSNVLVETVDGRARPKLVDFGIASEGDLGEARRTLPGQVLGTLAYMSPEQAGGASVDARSDVYALGAVAYELCTGRTPLEVAGLALAAALRCVREDLPEPAARRDPLLAGDVDTILTRALEKDPARRYASAAAFSADLRRHLESRPILARPATRWYRATRFARRHRALVVGVGAVLASLAVGLTTTTWQALRAADSAADARAALVRARAVAQFQREALERVAPARGGRELRLVDVLESTAAALPGGLAGTPDIEAALRTSLGRAWRELGLYDAARGQLERARELYAQSLGSGHPESLEADVDLARVLFDQGHVAQSLALLEPTQTALRARQGPDDLAVLSAERLRVSLIANLGRVEEAEATARALLATCLERFGERDMHTANSHATLGAMLWRLGRPEAARDEHAQALATARELLDPADPRLLTLQSLLANTLRHLGRAAEAAELYEQAVALGRPIYGAAHPDLWTWMNNLAGARTDLGDRAGAEPLLWEVFDLRVAALGEEHADTLIARTNLALFLSQDGRLEESIELHREGLAIKRSALGDDHESTLTSLHNLGLALMLAGDVPAALACFDEACERAPRVWPGGHWRQALFAEGRGACLAHLGRTDEARAVLADALARMQADFGPDDARTRSIAERLARL